jgi:hypothetical protein
MDGLVPHLVVGEVDTDDGPQPYCTTDMQALKAVGAAHGAQVAREAAELARRCVPRTPFDPAAAALAAERHHRDMAERRHFLADRIQGLRDAGRLTFAQHRAAEEIGDLIVWHDSGKQIMSRSQFSERLAASTGGIAMQYLLEEADRLRFGPWCRWASDFPVKAPDRTLEHLVRVFISQGLGIRQLANTFAMDQRRAERLLVRGLSRYAAVAGWEDEAKAA